MKTIGVVTVGRSDYGIYLPLLEALRAHPGLEPALYVGGMHLSAAHGSTVARIEADGWPIAARVPMLDEADDSERAVAEAMGRGVSGFAAAFAARRPDLLVVLGDRYEMFAAAAAAVPFSLPLLHLHGGELTEGAMDERFRHAITKLSHLHGVAAEPFARRVIQLGEEPGRVRVTGALALDHVVGRPAPDRAELARRFGLDLSEPPLLVTLHPTTTEPGRAGAHIAALLEALERAGRPAVFTLPNADMEGRVITEAIRAYVAKHPNARLVDNFGPEGYFAMLREAAAMVGNSSSGILEAASFRLPVVNIGTRQQGRLRADNVLDVPFDAEAIGQGIATALSEDFRVGLANLANPYGDGHAAERLVAWIEEALALPPQELLFKRFHDL